MNPSIETKAVVRNVHLSAPKGRLVADLIRGKSVAHALNLLTFTPKKAAQIVRKSLESALANAEHNTSLDIDTLKVKSIFVDKARATRRLSARAKGRGNSMRRHHCHIFLTVGE